MATPVGPAARDPDDPDLWEDWYGRDMESDDEEVGAGAGYGWPLRLIALIVAVGIAALYVLAR